MNEQAQAWKDWIESHKETRLAATLGSNEPDRYLENRLWTAFMAGYEAAEKEKP